VANVLVALSDFVVDVPEDIAILICDRPIIIYDNTVRRAKIACGLNFMDRVSELFAGNPELVANVIGWIFAPIPNDASHAQVYSSHADQSLSERPPLLSDNSYISETVSDAPLCTCAGEEATAQLAYNSN
jgi:hypothetical protein